MNEAEKLMSILQLNQNEIDNLSNVDVNSQDFQKVLKIAEKNKILPVFYSIIKNKSSIQSQSVIDLYEDFIRNNTDNIDKQLKTLEYMGKILDEHEMLWIKGLPLSKILYGDIYYRKSGDMDFLVKKEEIHKIVDKLVDRGFKKVGVMEDIGLRFSVHYHEIQLMSPNDVLIEIKSISGEMDIFSNYNDLVSAFWENQEMIEIENYKLKTVNKLFTYIHLFLGAFSNSTAVYDMESTGLRDLYEICQFHRNKKIDYEELYSIANKFGFSYVISGLMRRVNSIWDDCFENHIIEMFEHPNKEQHMMSILYKKYLENNKLNIVDELFYIDKKYKNYMDSVSKAYYENDEISFIENRLDKGILEYDLKIANDVMRLIVDIDKENCCSKTESVVVLKFLCNDKKVINDYGHVFVLWIVFKNGKEEVLIKNEPNYGEYKHYEKKLDLKEKIDNGNRIRYICEFDPWFLNIYSEKICYNVQLSTKNPNDDDQSFDLTIMCPQKNALPIYHTGFLKDMRI
jgi:hypothetical protein